MIEGMSNDPNHTAEGLFRRGARADDFNRLKQIGRFLFLSIDTPFQLNCFVSTKHRR
jgi:hypothetical protein